MTRRVGWTAVNLVKLLRHGEEYGIADLMKVSGFGKSAVSAALADAVRRNLIFRSDETGKAKYRLPSQPVSAPPKFPAIQGYDSAIRSFRDLCMATRPAIPVKRATASKTDETNPVADS